ncbi:MAG: EAL domain-containing protein [Pseudomonadota bacterium]
MFFSTLAGSGYLPSHYSAAGVVASVVIATLASYVALDLVRRVHATRRVIGLIWWGAGAAVMGTGIWAMHFVGMMAFTLPIAIGFTSGLTLLSWLAAVGASAVALGVAGRMAFGLRSLLVGAAAMALGICGMHYIGMAAMDMAPPIVWDPVVVALSVAIAAAASAVALLIFYRLLRVSNARRVAFQVGAALVLGAAICGMHYVGMAAAHFPEGAVCLSASELGGSGLTEVVAVATALLLMSTLLISILDARLQNTAERLTQSLQGANAQLKTANAELKKRAFTDPLTRLPNRLLFEDRLAHALVRLDRANHSRVERRLAVLFIDLDGFKPINDSFGHAAGDHILREAAERLRQQARQGDTVARVGGDEFLLLLEDVPDAADCVLVARKIIALLSTPFVVSDKQMQIACSIGVVLYPDSGQHDKLIANADAAMYAAKRAGGSCFALFEPSMGADAGTQLELLSDLRQALELKQFSLHYQPKINGIGGRIHGVEALLRWTHPVRGNVPPDDFIGMAERFGLIVRIGAWVIDEACRQIAQWRTQGLLMRVAVNLSVHQLRESGLADTVQQALDRHAVDAEQLMCEITESVAMEDMKITKRAFDGLARIGVYLAIDDFGTGYSSLSYLRQLPARQLKIDRSFVSDIETSVDARAVVEAVIGLAHALGLLVVAEGVETAGQRDILLAMACDELQGFYFARPMPADTLLEWSRGQKPDDAADFAPSTIAG